MSVLGFVGKRLAAEWYLLTSRPKINVIANGRGGIVYKEGKKTMRVKSEWLAGPPYDVAIDYSSIARWEPPFDEQPLGEIDRAKIRQNIERALNGYEIDWS